MRGSGSTFPSSSAREDGRRCSCSRPLALPERGRLAEQGTPLRERGRLPSCGRLPTAELSERDRGAASASSSMEASRPDTLSAAVRNWRREGRVARGVPLPPPPQGRWHDAAAAACIRRRGMCATATHGWAVRGRVQEDAEAAQVGGLASALRGMCVVCSVRSVCLNAKVERRMARRPAIAGKKPFPRCPQPSLQLAPRVPVPPNWA